MMWLWISENFNRKKRMNKERKKERGDVALQRSKNKKGVCELKTLLISTSLTV